LRVLGERKKGEKGGKKKGKERTTDDARNKLISV